MNVKTTKWSELFETCRVDQARPLLLYPLGGTGISMYDYGGVMSWLEASSKKR